MKKVKPLVRCVDCWPCKIPKEKLAVYKQFIDEGQITKPHVIYNRQSGMTTVEYLAIAPHEWIREEMRKRV